MSGYYEQLAAVVKADKVSMIKEDKDMEKTLDELVKAIKEDHKWANETSVIFENEMPDIYQSPEEKAFLNGVKFATRKYMDILETNGIGGYENE